MQPYVAPLREMRFAIEAVGGLDEIAALPGFGEVTAETTAAILDAAGRLAGDVLAPLNQTGDREGCRLADGVVTTPAGFRAAYDAFRDGGWCGMTADPADGGQGLPRLVATAAWETFHAANMAFALCPMLSQGAVTLLARHGDARLRRIVLPKLASGAWTGAMAMTEPQAGSDVGAVACRAEPDGDAFRLRGQKIFTSWGEHDLAENIVHLVLARLPGAPAGSRGLSLFVVPKFMPDEDGRPGRRNDVRCLALERKLGLHASPTCVIAYGESEGAVGWLIGEPGGGLHKMFTMMNDARLGVGHEGLGVAERALQQARAFAAERRQGRAPDGSGPVPIARHAEVRRMLLAMSARVQAMRALCYYAARCADLAARHPDPAARASWAARVGLLTPVVKAWCTDGAVEVATTAIQVHGGAGYIEDTGVAQHLRDARVTQIYEGTNGIQALDLVRRKLAGDGGTAVGALLDALGRTAAETPESAALAPIGAALAAGTAALARTSRTLIERCRVAPEAAGSGAYPYLQLFGAVAGGWLLARAAALAARRIAENDDADGFHAGKLAAARFYAATVLAQADALAIAATDGADAVVADAAPEKF